MINNFLKEQENKWIEAENYILNSNNKWNLQSNFFLKWYDMASNSSTWKYNAWEINSIKLTNIDDKNTIDPKNNSKYII